MSVRYPERLADNDIVASVGSRGDSDVNAMAENFNGLYELELIDPKGPWKGFDGVEFAALGYIDWFNTAGSIARSPRRTPTSLQQSSKPSTAFKHSPPSRRLPNSPNSHGNRSNSPWNLASDLTATNS